MVSKSKSRKLSRVNIPIRSGVETFSGTTEYPKQTITKATDFYPNGPVFPSMQHANQKDISLTVGELGLELATHAVFMMAGTVFGFFIARIIFTLP